MDIKEYKKQYYKEHIKEIKAKSRKWYYEHQEYAKQRIKKATEIRFKKYPWLKTYASIQRRINHAKHYKTYGIKNLLTEKDVKFLWFRDEAYNMQLPSIDRKDGFGHYTLENCRFIEYIDNLCRPRAWRKKDISIANLGNTGRTRFKKGHK